MHILWVPLTLLCAFSMATSDAFSKKALATNFNEYLFAWYRLLLMAPFLLALLLSQPIPTFGPDFIQATLTALPLELAALILYYKALKYSPLGLTVPFLALTPLFLLLIPYLLLGEKISIAGTFGILLITAGGYSLNLRHYKEGLFAPFRAIIHQRGSLYMLGVAILYSVTSTLVKKSITASSPLFFAGFYPILILIGLTPIALWKGRKELSTLNRSLILRATLIPATFSLLETITGMIALSLTNVAYMIAVKRLSLLMGILYGHFMFNEEGIHERLAGGTLMIAGVGLILLGGS